MHEFLPRKYCSLAFCANGSSHGSQQSLPTSPFLLNLVYEFTTLGQQGLQGMDLYMMTTYRSIAANGDGVVVTGGCTNIVEI